MKRVILLGRLARDPELRQTVNNVAVASFAVAVNRSYQKEKEQLADFIECVAWRGTAEFVARYFAKGDPIALEGRLQVRSYEDKQGNKRRAYEVICENVEFTGSRERRQTDDAPQEQTYDASDFEEVDSDGDLPF